MIARRALHLAAAALLVSQGAGAQQAADAPSASVVGVACVDLDEDGACGGRDLPLPWVMVRSASGVAVRTDVDGRFHLAALGAERTTTLGDGLLPRPESSTLFLDVESLGPTARAPAPVTVPLVVGAVVPVELAARLPVRADAALPHLAGPPTVRVEGARWSAELPLALAPGHTLVVDGAPHAVDDVGVARVTVSLAEREAVLTLVDTADDGRATVARLRVLRVPRAQGGTLVVTAPLDVLARVDLPPPGRATAPGALLVPVRASPGVEVRVGEARAVVGAAGVAYLWTRATERVPIEVRRARTTHHAALPLSIDPLAAMSARLAGELRVGAVGLTPFAQGRVDGALRLPLPGTTISAGASVDDEVLGAALAGRLRLQPARSSSAPRSADPERDLAVWGDASRAAADNPAELALWARAEGAWGHAGLGAARTPLDDGEVGRFDRAVVGPSVDASVALAGVRVGVAAAGDASAVPVVDVAVWRKAHDQIEASGGRVYWLSQRRVAPSSARVAVEILDPLTGLVVERRVLSAGRDYELDLESGRVLLAAPLGRGVDVEGTRPGAFGAGWRTRLVADYAHLAGVDAARSHDAAAAVYVEAGTVVSGAVRGALAAGGDDLATLVGADVSARPFNGLELSASAAHSAGDPFAHADRGRSFDAGLSFTSPPAATTGGDAVAVRARLGDERSFAAAWGAFRAPGFADASTVDAGGGARLGAEGRLELAHAVAAGALVDAQDGADPAAAADEGARLASIDTSARLEGRLGMFRLALDGLYRRALRTADGSEQLGDAVAAGLEVGATLAPGVEAFAGHLQRVAGGGDGPGAADPTLSYVGARVPLGARALLHGRVGVHPDLRPEIALAAELDEGDGRSRYGALAVASEAPWHGRSTTLVSGARASLGPAAEVYAEDRLVQIPFDAQATWRGARVVGARVSPGPVFAGLAVESDTGVAARARGWHGAVTADAGFALSSTTVGAFTELVGDAAVGAPAVRHSALGAHVQARVFDDLTLGARAVIARGAPLDGAPERPSAEALVGGAWRPAGLPQVLTQYSVREDRREDLLVERLQLARLAVGIGALPGPQLLVSTQAAQHELAERATSLGTTQALLGGVRAVVPVWLLEPALEVGARAVVGGGLDPALAGTLRAELALRLGPAAVGAGVVLYGYTGTGLEPLTLSPAAPPIYVVVRGALP